VSPPYDFHLQSGSSAIDSGMTVSQTRVDFDDWLRPVDGIYDRGAFEYHLPDVLSLPLLQIHADALEVSGVTNGSTVTPAVAPLWFKGTVVVKGTGSIVYTSALVGGVYFLNCCTNSNNAYYKFTGTTVGSIFNVNHGQISFSLKSRYSFAQRKQLAVSPRYAFDVRDGNGKHLFYFLSHITTSGGLFFSYMAGGTGQYYGLAPGTEDAMFGSGVILKITLAWDGTAIKLYLNGALVKSSPSPAATANWTSASNFDLGAYEYQTFGGYNVSDDVIDEFTVQ